MYIIAAEKNSVPARGYTTSSSGPRRNTGPDGAGTRVNLQRLKMLIKEQEDDILNLPRDRTIRLLLVSCGERVRLSLEKFFGSPEFSLAAAATREEALTLLGSEKFDVVISDLETDVREGFALRSDIRSQNKRLPVLFMAPLADWSDAKLLDRIAEDPYSYCLPESSDRKVMTSKLRQIVNARRTERSLEQLRSRIDRSWFLESMLQQTMLPPWVYFSPAYEFSCVYRPFAKVSGDLFCVALVALLCSPPFVPPVVGAMGNKKVLISGIVIGLIGYAIGTYIGVALAYALTAITG